MTSPAYESLRVVLAPFPEPDQHPLSTLCFQAVRTPLPLPTESHMVLVSWEKGVREKASLPCPPDTCV